MKAIAEPCHIAFSSMVFGIKLNICGKNNKVMVDHLQLRHGDCVNHVKVHDILSKMDVHLFNLKLTEKCVRSILTGLLNQLFAGRRKYILMIT